MEMTTMDAEKLDQCIGELTLALMYLNRFKERNDLCWRAWKGYDFDALGRLKDNGLIYDSSHRSKSVGLSEEGIAKAKEILGKLDIADTDEPTEEK